MEADVQWPSQCQRAAKHHTKGHQVIAPAQIHREYNTHKSAFPVMTCNTETFPDATKVS